MPSSVDDGKPANGSAAGAAAGGSNAAVSPRQMRRGPAPFASFDHDVSDEARADSSPEAKLVIHLPEIREDTSSGLAGSDQDLGESKNGDSIAIDVPESRARSASSPAVQPPRLQAPPTPRIDISRASSSSHHDSRESSPDMAFPSELAFREEGALDLRSSTEELAFLEGAPGQEAKPKLPAQVPHPLAATAPSSRRHSRKDSQGSEFGMLGVCGRSSRLSSVGSQCSALSRISGLSRSPSPHRMLVETSFCGPRPIDNDPDTCERKVLEMARLSSDRRESALAPLGIATVIESSLPVIPSTPSVSVSVQAEVAVKNKSISTPTVIVDQHKQQKEIENKAVATERRRERAKEQRKRGEVVRIRLKPNSQYDDDDDEEIEIEESISQQVSKPVTLELKSRDLPPARTPSPAMGTPQRKASFCSLFRASPESPASGARRKKSLTEGRPRSSSSSRERPSGLRGSVLSLFRSSRKSSISPPPPSFNTQPPIPMKKIAPVAPTPILKYYEKSVDGIIHIPLHSPPNEPKSKAVTMAVTESSENVASLAAAARPPSAASQKLALTRTVLPDGSIIIPLHSPTDKTIDHDAIEVSMYPNYENIEKQDRELRTTAIRSYEAPMAQSIASPILHSKETEVTATIENCEPKRNKITKQHVVFSTNIEGGDLVFSTQLSVTKTPSLCSETSVDVALPLDTEPVRQESDEKKSPISNRTSGQATAANTPKSDVTTPRSEVISPKYGGKTSKSLRKLEDCVPLNKKSDHNGTTPTTPLAGTSKIRASDLGMTEIEGASMTRADSSGSEGNSDIAFSRRDVEDTEKRGLVLGQESFEDELPYVPTTLPLERPLGVPIIPVKDRGDVQVAPVQRPRPSSSSSQPKPISKLTATTNPNAEKLRITLPSKPRSGSKQKTPVPRAEWIDFEEVPERKKQPKRIQILPDTSGGGDASPGSDECVVYVAPEQCRCECHHRPANSSSSVECDTEGCSGEMETEQANLQTVELRVHIGRPFNTDLDLRQDSSMISSEQSGRPF